MEPALRARRTTVSLGDSDDKEQLAQACAQEEQRKHAEALRESEHEVARVAGECMCMNQCFQTPNDTPTACDLPLRQT